MVHNDTGGAAWSEGRTDPVAQQLDEGIHCGGVGDHSGTDVATRPVKRYEL